MRIAGIEKNDIINGEGVSVSVWMQGCPFHCKGCHNPETWNFDGGIEDTRYNFRDKIFDAIEENDIQRNFSILGGEPLCQQNVDYSYYFTYCVKRKYPNIKIFLWTGYELEELDKMYNIQDILKYVDVLITGRYIEEERDVTLKWRGSRNQKILYKGIDF